MSEWEQQIESDLSWREAEMGTLKLLLAAAPARSDRQRALLRACSAMLYAHYEGFCKFCWTLLLNTIASQKCLRRDLVTPLAKRAMASVFSKLRGDTSIENLWNFAWRQFQQELVKVSEFPDEVDTKSNLWPELSQSINASVGLECPLLNVHATEIGQLVGRRNKIAHGEKLEIADLAQFQKIEHAAILVMHELALSVVDCLNGRSYTHTVDPSALI
jgi:hypothetical protein